MQEINPLRLRATAAGPSSNPFAYSAQTEDALDALQPDTVPIDYHVIRPNTAEQTLENSNRPITRL